MMENEIFEHTSENILVRKFFCAIQKVFFTTITRVRHSKNPNIFVNTFTKIKIKSLKPNHLINRHEQKESILEEENSCVSSIVEKNYF